MLNFLGRFHPLLVHLPIGILLLAVLFALLGRWQRFQHLKVVVPFALLMGTLAAIFSCVTGYLLSLSGEYDFQAMNQHRNLGIAVAVWGALLLLLQKSGLNRRFGFLFQVILVTLVSIAGHLGGSLTHGSDYLTQGLPEPYRAWLGLPPAVLAPAQIKNLPEANAYAAVVAPLLQEKCVSCHGSTKQKGKLRLDSPDFIQKGGKNGEIVAAGKVADSEMIRRLLLPKSDEKHMPPKEKNQLSESEVKLLHWWIETGAAFDKKVKDLPQSEEVKPLLAALQKGETASAPEVSIWPEVKVPAPDQQAIQALRDAGAVVIPLGQNNTLLSVNFINVPDAKAKDLALLKPLAKQVVALRLSGVAVGDQDLKILAELPHLTKLFLDGTKLSDAGLSALKAAKYLNYLNLINTKVSKAGLAHLKAVTSLREVYVYQTAIKGSADWQALKSLLPKVNIDTGGYIVPTLVSDTTLVTEASKEQD